ncbi:hypothetical protein [Janthinobacterium sp. UMAB-56]|uniref:hypothetical protein n=1 Tax=Janthinobacterium sp. UMAB-56 TaxID=1365361 RepID=UPI001C57DBC1|nr:hypothetical protein [Janthinobacterium sp. UMAB-56]
MKRIDTVNREIDKFGAGKDGFRAARPGVSEATYLSAEFFNAIQEAIVRVIEQAGLIPSNDHNQFADAIALGSATAVRSLKESLVAESGTELIGNGGETVAQSFQALQLPDYAALKAYEGPRQRVDVSGYRVTARPAPIAGQFVLDPSDNTSITDDGTVFRAAGGGCWKRIFEGGISSAWFGCDHTGQTDSTAAFQKFANCLWRAVSTNTPWAGIGQGHPVGIVEPGRLRVTGTTTFPTNILLTARAHPANTGSHTRIIMDSTAVTPSGRWQASYQFQQFSTRLPTTSNGFYYRANTKGVSGAVEPAWPTAVGATVTDGDVTWTCFAVVSGDNRNKPIIKWSRASLDGAILCNAAVNSTVQWMEFWYVTVGSTFDLPLSGSGINYGDYPDGGSLYFDVDATDFRIVQCVFQNAPAHIRIAGVGTTPAMRSDGFIGSRGVNLFLVDCELDSAGAHIDASLSYIDINNANAEMFGARSYITGCTGRYVQNGGRMFGAPGGVYASIRARTSHLELFKMSGVDIQRQGFTEAIDIDRTDVVDIDCTFSGATTSNDVRLVLARGGRVTGVFDNSGFDAPPGTGPSDYVAAIKLDGCRGVTCSPVLMASATGGAFNGHGVLTVSIAGISSDNLIQGYNITAPYNGAGHDGYDRYINIQPADLIGPGSEGGGIFPKQILRGSGGFSVQGTKLIAGTTYGETQNINLAALIISDGVYLVYANSYANSNGALLNTATFIFTQRQSGGSVLQTLAGPTNNAGSGAISTGGTSVTYTYTNLTPFVATLSYNRISDGNFI